jgi:hypothetical protein
VKLFLPKQFKRKSGLKLKKAKMQDVTLLRTPFNDALMLLKL